LLEVLIEREKRRAERRTGSAKRHFEAIHVGKLYDLELDTGDSVDANVDRLLAAWRSAKRSSSFHSHKIRAKVSTLAII
jgi:chloramphenicol 3-O phosphotransferase